MNQDVLINHPLVSLFKKKMEEENYVHFLNDLRKNLSFSAPFGDIGNNNEYFEWTDILEAVSEARNRFVMFELGAGYGRWCINAMVALKFLNPIPCHFVAVEAEPSHFKFLKEFLLLHGLNLDEHRLVQAAVDARSGFASFHMGDPEHWYGQCIEKSKKELFKSIFYMAKVFFSRADVYMEKRKEVVRVISLNSLLAEYECVDLIDMDIQGSEVNVIKGSIAAINQKVKRMNIATHNREIDEELKGIFQNQGWKNLHLYSCGSELITPDGPISFQDGAQTWINPRITGCSP